jgi:poly(A) polymerase
MTDSGRIAPTWLAEPAVRRLIGALSASGIEARFVGGAVRDALLGEPPPPAGDIDLATPASPQQVAEALAKSGIKAVPTGLAHGTVTAVVPPRAFEITTLRRDVETDGRHARVAFGADWAEDAARRDFTINAIFLAADGRLHDPVGGLADLKARRVRFVGDPAKRIAEDVLRLLRYYRFEARFGTGGGDAEARDACRAAAPLLPALSAERVQHELLGLLAARDPVPALGMMAEDGVLATILPEASRLDRLQNLVGLEARPDVLRRLAALVVADLGGTVALADRLRLSKAARDRFVGLVEPWPFDPDADEKAQRRALYRLGADRYRDLAVLNTADGRMGKARLAVLLDLVRDWAEPLFPLRGKDVAALGVAPGPRTGELLAAVRIWWEEGDFTADRNACLARLAELANAGRGAGGS